MRISIFGLGYVGAVCAGCLSARGHDVVGVDVAKDKIDMINAGKSPIVEPGLVNFWPKASRQVVCVAPPTSPRRFATPTCR